MAASDSTQSIDYHPCKNDDHVFIGIEALAADCCLTLEFEGINDLSTDAARALQALAEATEALDRIAGFQLKPNATLRQRLGRSMDEAPDLAASKNAAYQLRTESPQ
jgi:hypothetical protein